MVNPNSIATVSEVIEHVLDITRVKDPEQPRKWAIIHSDGVPYVYASELQDNLFVCNICGEEINKGDMRCEMWNTFLDEHTKKCSRSFEFLFDNIMFVSGPGHIELNLARLLLRFLWQPFLSHFVKCIGFRIYKAQQVALNGVDHHRSKQLLSSCFEALSKELLVPYICYCTEKGEEASNDGYQDCVDNFIDDPTYLFLYHVTYTHLLGFHLYNEATRKKHSLRMMAARVQCSKLFFSFHHRKYQKLLVRDLCQRVQMPETLVNYITSHERFSVSGEKNTGEGADFVHENSNKTTKSFLTPGMPTAETWR